MNINVLKSLCILLGVNLLLLAVSFLYEYSSKNQILNHQFRFITIAEILDPSLTPETNVSFKDSVPPVEFTAQNDTVSQEDSLEIELDPQNPQYVEGEIFPEDTIASEFYLYNPKRGERKAFDNFFESLYQLEKSENITLRIGHYGDSQIEGDRITSYIRLAFYKRFKGSGIGFVPFYEPANHHALVRKMQKNWRRYTCFHGRYSNSYYGLCGTVYRFLPARNANYQVPEDAVPQTATYDLQLMPWVKYHKLNILWGNAKTSWQLKTILNDTTILRDTFPAEKSFQISQIPVPSNAKKIHFEFEAVESPDFYGFTFDGKYGLMVDNFALRGHSGNGFHIMNTQFLKSQYDSLGHKLIILQFGGNIVPYTNVKNFNWYEEDLYRLLLKFKKAAPDASILVVSTMDMGYKSPNGVTSYPTVPKVRDAQKRASLRAGVSFLDLYEAMGGKGAIVEWYRNGWSLNDYAHLSDKGQRKISELIVSALLDEYEKYKESPMVKMKGFLSKTLD